MQYEQGLMIAERPLQALAKVAFSSARKKEGADQQALEGQEQEKKGGTCFHLTSTCLCWCFNTMYVGKPR